MWKAKTTRLQAYLYLSIQPRSLSNQSTDVFSDVQSETYKKR
jgi:hypothetical protein